MWGSLALVLLVFFGCVNMWTGYCIGTGKIQPIYLILHMPAGLLLGCIGMIGGMICGILAGIANINGKEKKRGIFVAAFLAFALGGILFALSL